MVFPYIIECAPQELFPITPPTVALLVVLGSGVKSKFCDFKI